MEHIPKIAGNHKDAILIAAALATVVIGVATLKKTGKTSAAIPSAGGNTTSLLGSGMPSLLGGTYASNDPANTSNGNNLGSNSPSGSTQASNGTADGSPASSAKDLATAIAGITKGTNDAINAQSASLSTAFQAGLSGLTTQFNGITSQFNTALGTLASTEQKDIAAASASISANSQAIGSLTGTQNSQGGLIADLQNGLNTLTNSVQSAFQGIANQFSQVFTQITGLQTQTANIETQVNANTALDAKMQAWINSINTTSIQNNNVLTLDTKNNWNGQNNTPIQGVH